MKRLRRDVIDPEKYLCCLRVNDTANRDPWLRPCLAGIAVGIMIAVAIIGQRITRVPAEESPQVQGVNGRVAPP